MNETIEMAEQQAREVALKAVESVRSQLDTSDGRKAEIDAEMAAIRAQNEVLKARVQVLMRQKEVGKSYDEQAMAVAMKIIEAVPNADEELIASSLRKRFEIPEAKQTSVQERVPKSPAPAPKPKEKASKVKQDGRRKYMALTKSLVLGCLDKEGLTMSELIRALNYDGPPAGVRDVLHSLIRDGNVIKSGILRGTRYHVAS